MLLMFLNEESKELQFPTQDVSVKYQDLNIIQDILVWCVAKPQGCFIVTINTHSIASNVFILC